MPTPQSWPNCEGAVYRFIIGFADLLKNKLHDCLVGIYLHGSLAMGSYFPPKSDMDFIIVTDDRLDAELAKDLNIAIARYAEERPTVGSIECSVITLETAKNVPTQIPYELHYSESWHERILNDQVVYGTRQTDPDLPAHLMCVKKRGVCLYGEEIDKVFGEVSRQSFMLAVLDDFDWIVANENICESPYYGILNICRILQILRENNRHYLSKFEGAIWGIENLPHEHTPLIEKALAVYCSNKPIEEHERKTGGVDWAKADLLTFRDYAKEEREKHDKGDRHTALYEHTLPDSTTFVYGTGNPAKLQSMRDCLKPLDIQIIGLKETGVIVPDAQENGKTPLENARIKALAYHAALKRPVFACDSGLYIDGLPEDEQPGVHVRMANGKRMNDDEMVAYYSAVARRLGGKAVARYKNAICLVISETEIYEHFGDDISGDAFCLVDKPHTKRIEGFPLDCISVHPETGEYYYWHDRENGSGMVFKGFQAYFRKVMTSVNVREVSP